MFKTGKSYCQKFIFFLIKQIWKNMPVKMWLRSVNNNMSYKSFPR